jgi:alpha-tubulin suppressor-like RCC1 family protein
MQRRTMMLALALALAVGALAACGGDSTGPGNLTPVATVSIADLPDTLFTGQILQLAAQATDDGGGALPDRPLMWASSDPDIASISTGGVLTALIPGSATISVTTDDVTDSVTVVVRTLDLVHVFAGATVSCGLEETGDAWCWGNVGADGYGNGSLDTTRSLVPMRAAEGYQFASLTLGSTSACGVLLNGGAACWGMNDHGELGTGTTMASGTPIVVSGVSDIVQLVAGAAHYCARSGSGAVTCWGSNEWKQTGQEQRADVTAPHAVALGGPATDLGAGDYHTCAVVAGSVTCWGSDEDRQLSYDTTYDRLIPVRAATGDGVNHTWTRLTANFTHTCGQELTGAVYCWGWFPPVESDDPSTTAWVPMRRFEGLVVSDLGDSYDRQCVVNASNEAWCGNWWSPLVQLAWPRPVTAVAGAGPGPCLLDDTGAVGCQTVYDPSGPVKPFPLPDSVMQLAGAAENACALTATLQAYCWYHRQSDPVIEQSFGTRQLSAVFGGESTSICAIAPVDSILCWNGHPGMFANANVGTGHGLVSLAIGDAHMCGLTASGSAWCWGWNKNGQLGDVTTTEQLDPVPVQGGHTFVQLVAGLRHTCGLTATGEIWCWGDGSVGEMADDHRDESATPVPVNGLGPATEVAGTCALDPSGSVWCWPTTSTHSPVATQVSGATGLVSLGRACGLRSDGELLCWRDNVNGQFGNGTFNTSYAEAVSGGSGIRFKEVSLGNGGSACGIGLDGKTYCWGGAYGAVPVVMIGS